MKLKETTEVLRGDRSYTGRWIKKKRASAVKAWMAVANAYGWRNSK